MRYTKGTDYYLVMSKMDLGEELYMKYMKEIIRKLEPWPEKEV